MGNFYSLPINLPSGELAASNELDPGDPAIAGVDEEDDVCKLGKADPGGHKWAVGGQGKPP